MRISDTQFSQMMLQSLQTNNAGLGKVMQQMSTGERMTKLSDDPMASIKLLNLEREDSAITQYQNNIANVKTILSSQEVYLDSVTDSLQNMRDRILWGANGTMTTDDRAGIITELNNLRDSITSAFNAQDEEGVHLFSGTATDTPSLDANYNILGNSDKRVVTVAKGVTMETNITALDVLDLGGGNNILKSIDGLIAEFQAPTANFQNEVSNTINDLDITANNVLSAITEMGGRHNNLDLMNSSHTDNKLFVEKVNDELSALDYSEASVRLNSFMAALQATQASYVKIDGLSLFDRI
ncbi:MULTISPECIES: flagellar hook-associated protein FlgL [Vibrio]|jgi:flagellar hook-associated protein 3 FlgL|uniref:Flagellar hook-associated protein 3 n=1 Tax=Vibrio diazotrophicus TaxID=685 RepID=A0A2J8HWF1_VIBDI|nr:MULTISPECIES: flagellar hook-associated protein FlgL [Vibrio]MCF7364138.1 flagellar hook-associated protein FlgL [Vibrio sp. A1-b2]PNH78867.1 flagellar hook-associated protein 3 [Vibrio diazotrophicus]PNI02124.1 flagellar hook-associated protein 3 [Vibrio diazotrophicus]PNI02561.1 flagellar hook-associated protein 3 [Vibrio diazotrophicus]